MFIENAIRFKINFLLILHKIYEKVYWLTHRPYATRFYLPFSKSSWSFLFNNSTFVNKNQIFVLISLFALFQQRLISICILQLWKANIWNCKICSYHKDFTLNAYVFVCTIYTDPSAEAVPPLVYLFNRNVLIGPW